MPRRYHSPRLKGFDYRGALVAHLVFVTRGRRPVFETTAHAVVACGALIETAERLKADVHAYCVMPDHIHVLVQTDEANPVTEFARRFKQLTGFRLKDSVGGVGIWQVSYYDHVLRADEDIRDVAHYIWSNPVEDGLALDYASYAHSGPAAKMTAWNR